ncbi:MAG: peptidylprolyl isomerase [Planctomyces sp.]|nr:peptidylprolyl isomerase [Planctomyces sp.]
MLFPRSNRQRQNRKPTSRDCSETVQVLEPRELLAGNAVVTLAGSQLTIVGDAEANTIEITALDNQVLVRGLENTTINGGTAAFVVASGTASFNGNVAVYLNAGNDTVLFSRNVQILGATGVEGAAGNDSVGSTGATFAGGFAFLGETGNDRLSLQDSTIGSLLWVRTNQGDDLISLEDVTINGRIWMKTGTGSDGVALNRVTVTDRVTMNTGLDQDDVSIQGSTIGGRLKIRTKRHADVVMLDENTFNGPVSLNTGSGEDNTQIRSTNTFNRLIRVKSGDGSNDAVEVVNPNTFNGGREFSRHESNTASPSVMSTRIDNTTTGVIGKATASNTFFNQLLVTSPQTLTVNGNRNAGVSSTGNVLITRATSFIVDGTTTPRSTVTIDSDGDGQFDDGTATADGAGAFTLTVTLTRRDLDTGDSVANDQRNGFQTLAVRSTDEAGSVQNATLAVDLVQNTVVRMVSNEGTYEVELFDNITPNTVANFMSYFSQYTGSIIHRSVSNFVIQGGGFTINNGVIDNVNTSAPITNEFNNTTSNIRGTLSMAQLGGDINSGTSQWFVNLADNGSTLDAVPHTVFGRVIGNGMTVVDAIAALNKFNFANVTGVSALNELPRRAPFDVNGQPEQPLTGTVSISNGSNVVTGTGTVFTQELTSINGNPGGSRSRISINGTIFNVQSITSDTQLVVSANSTVTASNVQARTDNLVDSEFVRFTSISEILDQV